MFLLSHISRRTTASPSASLDSEPLFPKLWFAKWKWIHYDASGDLAYCHICINGLKTDKIKVSIGHAGESTFIFGGFWNWKDATRCFNKHEASLLHKAAVDAVITVPKPV